MARQQYFGKYRAYVSRLNDPEERGRIKVTCPDIWGEDVESAWCEPCIPVCYDNGGDFCLPLAGETVWIEFEEGDPNLPIWVGNWVSEKTSPLKGKYKKLKDKVRVISYANCTIVMKEDKLQVFIGEDFTKDKVKPTLEITKDGVTKTK